MSNWENANSKILPIDKRILTCIVIVFCVLVVGCTSNTRRETKIIVNNGTQYQVDYQYYLDDSGKKVFHGKTYVYTLGGQLISETCFKDGIVVGYFYEWFDNGNIKMLSNLTNIDSNSTGTRCRYYQNNRMQYQLKLHNGFGEEVLYYPNGNTAKLSTYRAGRIVSTAYFSPTGDTAPREQILKNIYGLCFDSGESNSGILAN